MLADKPTSFKPLFRHSMEMNVIKKGVLEVYGLKIIGENNETDCKKVEKSERIEPRRRTTRSGSVAASSFYPANSGINRLEGGQNRSSSKQQQKCMDKFDEFNRKPGQKVFVTVYRTCTEYFAVIYPLKMILSARLPINCINLRTSRLEKLENNLIKLYFGLRNGEFSYTIVFKVIENEQQSNQAYNLNNQHSHYKNINSEGETTKNQKKKKKESCSTSSDDDEQSNDGHSAHDYKELHKSYLSSTDDEHESVEENNEDNIVTFSFDDHDRSNPNDFFVSWVDALSGKIEIGPNGELINNSKIDNKLLSNNTTNNLLTNNTKVIKNASLTTGNLLTVRTDDHRRRLSLQTIIETDGDM